MSIVYPRVLGFSFFLGLVWLGLGLLEDRDVGYHPPTAKPGGRPPGQTLLHLPRENLADTRTSSLGNDSTRFFRRQQR